MELPSNLIEIGNAAFGNCKRLDEIKIPASVKDIGTNAFFGTPWFEQIPKDEYGGIYADGILLHLEGNRSDLKVKEGTKIIAGMLAYYREPKLESIEFSDSVIYIGKGAFGGQAQLTKVKLSENLSEIGASAFSNCRKLDTLELLQKLKSIGGEAFYACDSLTSITLPETIEEVEQSSFEGSYDLVNSRVIMMPEHLRYIFVYRWSAKIVYY